MNTFSSAVGQQRMLGMKSLMTSYMRAAKTAVHKHDKLSLSTSWTGQIKFYCRVCVSHYNELHTKTAEVCGVNSFRLYLLFLDTFLLSFKTQNVETLLSRPESELLQRVFVWLTSVVFTGHIQLWTDSNWIMGIFVQLTVDKVDTLILFIPSSCPASDFNFLSSWYASHTHGVESDAQRCPIRNKRLWKWRYHSIQTTENSFTSSCWARKHLLPW